MPKCAAVVGAMLAACGASGGEHQTRDAALGRTCPELSFPYVPGDAVRGTCDEPFTIFQGQVTSAVPRNDIDSCAASIIDETGRYLVEEEPLSMLLGADEYGNVLLIQGCMKDQTKQSVGHFTYMTKRSAGTLTFRINAYDETGDLLQSGLAAAQGAVYPPVVLVEVSMSTR